MSTLATDPTESNRSYRKVHVEHLGGEVFAAHHQSSNRETLWSELFKEKERATMRKHLISRVISFSIKDTYQISVRMLWTREAQQLPLPGAVKVDPFIKGPVAVMCHDFGGKLTASWSWAKLVYPLHKAGISVVLVDFPGFGMSQICGRADVDRAAWLEKDWRIVVQLMDTLKIRTSHLITCGESCNLVLKMLKFVKLRLEMTHIFFNPVVRLDDVFPVDRLRRSGAGAAGLKALRKEQHHAFEILMHNSKVKIWAMFDQANPLAADTHDMFAGFEALPFASDQITVTDLGNEHMCTASAGSSVQVPVLFPCRFLKHGIIRFLKGDHSFKPPSSMLPEQAGAEDKSKLRAFQSAASAPQYGHNPNQAAHDMALNVALDVRAQTMSGDQALTLARAKAAGLQTGTLQAGLLTGSLGKSQSMPGMSATTGSFMQTTSPKGKNRPRDEILARAAVLFGRSPDDKAHANEGYISRPADIRKATNLACQLQRADVVRERENLLANTKAVTKLKNWTEMRGGVDDGITESVVLPQEAAWIEDALDLSMQTLEADAEKRRLSGPGTEDKYKRTTTIMRQRNAAPVQPPGWRDKGPGHTRFRPEDYVQLQQHQQQQGQRPESSQGMASQAMASQSMASQSVGLG